uniref:SAM-dependent methyltransferase n=1 Tax=Kitasatospora sp. NRRL F-6133 TaxID=1415539 RepID=U5YPH8_9ACTN|nr:SAM-dependent methyltransferase [Kitasatospora sp. NRRL F-6133]
MPLNLTLRRRITVTAIRAAKRWAPSAVRRWLWEREYTSGRWDYLDGGDDPLPTALVRKYARGGRILDLGCGTSANLRLDADGYSFYLGVDISPDAIERARRLGRPASEFEVADVTTFRPPGRFDLVLLREVVYYLPAARAAELVRRTGDSLTADGVIAVVIWNTELYGRTAEAVRRCGLPIVEEFAHRPDALTLVLGPPPGGSGTAGAAGARS